MKKCILIVLCCLTPFLTNANDCYGEWLGCYDDAEATYSSDVSYCSGRGLDTKSMSCYRYANADFGDSIDGCAASFEDCLNQH